MNDKILGYIILMIIALFVLSPIVYVCYIFFSPRQTLVVEFPNVRSTSFLNPQDAVRFKGIQVGVVSEIQLHNNHALVKLKTDNSFRMHEGYEVIAYLKGLMGDRYVKISNGDQVQPVIPQTAILNGSIVEGPTEILAYIMQLRKIIHEMNNIVILLKDGSEHKTSFLTKFNSIVSKTDTISTDLIAIIEKSGNIIEQNRDSLETFMIKAFRITDSINQNIPEMIQDIDKIVTSTSLLLKKVELFSIQTDSMITQFLKPDNLIWKNDLKMLQDELKSLREVLIDIKGDGIKLPVRPW